ncbi:glycosyltransferase [Aestuariibaculum sp. M13]|uniref:glycosyltransferase family 2 protein n=1 Tax=Aestuariibaculum sp. M13 TaxID=2967132 RepID=UPI002159FF71|nr:glycosyltransferase family 2 protein [Aestuariibaculum sp. M13]MCR8666366.1 glycosyltransferase [Aestuariibaculum sp. M13]
MPKLSIITINYNNAKGLKQTIDSVCSQTFNDYEYVVIDGGSTDGSQEVLQQYKHKFDYCISEPDGGIYNAMNKGIKAAKGDYLLFLNSGDWLADNEVLDSVVCEFGDAHIIYGNMAKVYANGTVKIDYGVAGEPITLRTFVAGNLNHQSVFIKKSLFDAYGYYDESLKVVADWKLYLLALGLNAGRAVYVDRLISYFDMSGISSTNLELRNKERNQVIQTLVPEPILNDVRRLMYLEKLVKNQNYKLFEAIQKQPYLLKISKIIVKGLNKMGVGKVKKKSL